MSIVTPSMSSANPEGVLETAAARRRRDSLSWAVLAVVIIATLGLLLATGRLTHGIPGMGWLVMLGALLAQGIYAGHNSRCPSCDRNLGALIRSAHFCPRCGTRLMPSNDRAV
jgi:drug/metabolite transporter (DMT)-like permease